MAKLWRKLQWLVFCWDTVYIYNAKNSDTVYALKGRMRYWLKIGMASKVRIIFFSHFRKKNENVPYGLKKQIRHCISLMKLLRFIQI